jgi:hypothetical protein
MGSARVQVSPEMDVREEEQSTGKDQDRNVDIQKEGDKQGNKEGKKGQETEAEATDEKQNQALEEIKEKQKEIQDSFEQAREKLEEVQKMNQELKNPEPMEDTDFDQDEISDDLDEIQQQLKQQQMQKAGQQQKKSSQKMKNLGKKLQQMQANMQMEMIQENMEQLEMILDDLVKLSYKQEEILDGFKEVREVDPRYVELSQEQLRLKDNAQVIEDSLLALAERVTQISSFVTREVGEVNRNVDEALEALRERKRNRALTNQQYAMTSINNLALLLDDVLKQMQMSMSQAMGKPKAGQQNQQNLPNMRQLQQQLSEQINELKKSGKQGRELSEELARMAAEQEMIRQQLQELKEKLNGQPGGEKSGDNLGKIIEEMEKNEIDLVNKRLTDNLIQRQQKIITRMLETEESLREQELDDEREAESATSYERRVPSAFEEYLKAKEKELELLKKVPLDLNPFYKKEVNDYFRRLSSGQQ